MKRLGRRKFISAASTLAGASLMGIPKVNAAITNPPAKNSVSLAFTGYQRYLPLATGDIVSDTVDLNWVRGPRGEMLAKAKQDPEVNGGEGSMLQHLLRVNKGDDSMVALPIYLLRNFPARDFYVLKGSKLKAKDLKGKRIGIYRWAASGAVWYRHFLRYLGFDPKEMKWIVGGVDKPRPAPNLMDLPDHVSYAPSDKSLSDLLLDGKIDAYCASTFPEQFRLSEGPIVRLFADYQRVEEKYFTATKCYPPQHVMLMRKEFWNRNQAVAEPLISLFNNCEQHFLSNQDEFPYATPWQLVDVENTLALMGKEFHMHGYENNYHAVDEFCKTAYEDQMTATLLKPEDYFSDYLAQ